METLKKLQERGKRLHVRAVALACNIDMTRNDNTVYFDINGYVYEASFYEGSDKPFQFRQAPGIIIPPLYYFEKNVQIAINQDEHTFGIYYCTYDVDGNQRIPTRKPCLYYYNYETEDSEIKHEFIVNLDALYGCGEKSINFEEYNGQEFILDTIAIVPPSADEDEYGDPGIKYVFKFNDYIYEAYTDAEDGYRSHGAFNAIPAHKYPYMSFMNELAWPIRIKFVNNDENDDEMSRYIYETRMVNVETGETILRIYTNRSDSYYPYGYVEYFEDAIK